MNSLINDDIKNVSAIVTNAIRNAYVYTFEEIIEALSGTQDGETINIYIKNNIIFTSHVLINRSISIILINDSGNENVTLSITNGGTFRHFTTGAVFTNNLSITINAGIILYGANTGGGIEIYGNYCMLTLNSSVITSCQNNGYGGGIYIYGRTSGNSLIMMDALISSCYSYYGGAVYSDRCHISMNGSEISGNSAVLGGGMSLYSTDIVINNSKVNRNYADYDGGGIYLDLTELLANGNTEISDNQAVLTGGGICGTGDYSIIIEENTKIINNHAYSSFSSESEQHGGGGIGLFPNDDYSYGARLTIRDNATFKGNTSVSYGGAIWIYPLFIREVNVNIEGGLLEGNSANYGGAISIQPYSIYNEYTYSLRITNVVMAGNMAETDGGAVIAKDSLVYISNCDIINNTAGRNGGGIFTNDLLNVTVDNTSVFSENIARNYVFWTVTSGGYSDIHLSHIFTDIFSSFIPVQTPPEILWFFTNAYNNYDINFVMPRKSLTVIYADTFNRSEIIHETIIDSFLGAVVVIEPQAMITDIDNAVWLLQPPDQPAQTLELIDPDFNYTVTFFVEERREQVVVTEKYIDLCCREIMEPTQTLVEFLGEYRKTAPIIPGYLFIGYRINNGPLRTGTVKIARIDEDTLVTFVYKKLCSNVTCRCCRCRCCRCCQCCRCSRCC